MIEILRGAATQAQWDDCSDSLRRDRTGSIFSAAGPSSNPQVELSFKRMTPEHAGSIAAWSYPAPYHVYGYDGRDEARSREELADPRNHFFAALAQEELIGFRSFGADGRVPGVKYGGSYLDTGGGLRPDLMGKGLGPEVVLQGLRFGAASFGSESFRVTIAAFNQRALKVCARIGFGERDRFRRSSDGEAFVILTIDSLPSSLLPERSLPQCRISNNGPASHDNSS